LDLNRQPDFSGRGRRAQPIAVDKIATSRQRRARSFFRALFLQPARELLSFDTSDLAVFQFLFAIEQPPKAKADHARAKPLARCSSTNFTRRHDFSEGRVHEIELSLIEPEGDEKGDPLRQPRWRRASWTRW
jgi:hypothetical protein